MMDAKLIGKRLIYLRGNRSQKEVAEANEITQAALSNYELGDRIPLDPIKMRLAKYYDVSVADLFFAEECNEKIIPVSQTG